MKRSGAGARHLGRDQRDSRGLHVPAVNVSAPSAAPRITRNEVAYGADAAFVAAPIAAMAYAARHTMVRKADGVAEAASIVYEDHFNPGPATHAEFHVPLARAASISVGNQFTKLLGLTDYLPERTLAGARAHVTDAVSAPLAAALHSADQPVVGAWSVMSRRNRVGAIALGAMLVGAMALGTNDLVARLTSGGQRSDGTVDPPPPGGRTTRPVMTAK
jgi:hypothetical protein